MYLIIGLGNPGEQYTNTRHNVGFLVMDEVARMLETDWHRDKKSFREVASVLVAKQKIILAKPTTFMNESGLSARALKSFYRVPLDHIIVVHDDLDLPLGTIRVSFNSGSAGHNGIKSCIAALGSKKFWRVRVGVAGEKRASTPADQYVLKTFTKTEHAIIAKTIKKAAETLVESLRSGELTARTVSLAAD